MQKYRPTKTGRSNSLLTYIALENSHRSSSNYTHSNSVIMVISQKSRTSILAKMPLAMKSLYETSNNSS